MVTRMGYQVADASRFEWDERPPAVEGQQPRLAADVTTGAGLQQSRARVWRYPAGTRGRRHADKAQEEVFVVISGQMTMLLGEPPDRIEVGPQSVVAVQPGTPLQVRNEGSEELVLYIYGAPPEQEGADFFDDPGDL
jgi:mannose-6-phosphate isomerase-like protein (cupin superfamily)